VGGAGTDGAGLFGPGRGGGACRGDKGTTRLRVPGCGGCSAETPVSTGPLGPANSTPPRGGGKIHTGKTTDTKPKYSDRWQLRPRNVPNACRVMPCSGRTGPTSLRSPS